MNSLPASNIPYSVIIHLVLSRFTLNSLCLTKYHSYLAEYAESRYEECRYAQRRLAKCRLAECRSSRLTCVVFFPRLTHFLFTLAGNINKL